jgi:hypothetical protein
MAMDSRLTIKPRNLLRDYGRPNTARPDAKPASGTNLPVPLDVASDDAPLQEGLIHDLVDPQNRDMIYREREERERRRRRAPDEALERQRVYGHPVESNAQDHTKAVQIHTDFEI